MAKRKSTRKHDRQHAVEKQRDETDDRRESGEPGGGQGRRDTVGPTGVYPQSATERPRSDAPVRTERSWGQGERGAAGYEDSGGSELTMREGQLLGGLTAGPSGEPTIDIHGGDRSGAAAAEGAQPGERERESGGEKRRGKRSKRKS